MFEPLWLSCITGVRDRRGEKGDGRTFVPHSTFGVRASPTFDESLRNWP